MLAEIGTILQFGALGLLGYMIWLFHCHIEREAIAQAELRKLMAEKVLSKLEAIEKRLTRDRCYLLQALDAIRTYVLVANGSVRDDVKESVAESLKHVTERLAALEQEANGPQQEAAKNR